MTEVYKPEDPDSAKHAELADEHFGIKFGRYIELAVSKKDGAARQLYFELVEWKDHHCSGRVRYVIGGHTKLTWSWAHIDEIEERKIREWIEREVGCPVYGLDIMLSALHHGRTSAHPEGV